MRNWEKANPMKETPVNVTAGKNVSTKGHGSHSMGAGKQMGAPIAKEYPLTGSADTKATGGKFAGADKAKMTKTSTRKGKG